MTRPGIIKRGNMICVKCQKEAQTLRYDKVLKDFVCRECRPVVRSSSPSFLHCSVGNKWAPKLSVAKNDVFTRSKLLPSGEVIDTATGREAAY